MHLTRELHGSYILLMIAYWDNGGPLPDDDDHLATAAKCPPADWQRTRKILSRFFNIGDGLWKHKRIEAELLKAQAESDAKSEGGKAGAQKRWRDSSAIPKPKAQPSQSESKSKSASESEPKSKASNILLAPKEDKKRSKKDPLEESLMTRLRMFLGTEVMEEHGGLWRTLVREHPFTVGVVIDDLQSHIKEGRTYESLHGAAYDLYQRLKPAK